MPAEVITLPVFMPAPGKKKGRAVISTVSKSEGIFSQLSPFRLGPCDLYWGWRSRNMENGWQYSKCYEQHIVRNDKGKIINFKDEYYAWAKDGWINPKAVRYPMGKGAKPAFSLWKGECLTYIDARKVIYAPLYAEAVQKTEAWISLVALYKSLDELILLDYDVRDTRETGETLTQVLNNPTKKMGHAFVLSMLLQDDPALEQLELR